jgi:hypothetical protein
MTCDATVSAVGYLLLSSAFDPVVPSIFLVSCGFFSCSWKNAGVIKFEGKALWTVYFDARLEYRRHSIRRVSARARTAALDAVIKLIYVESYLLLRYWKIKDVHVYAVYPGMAKSAAALLMKTI